MFFVNRKPYLHIAWHTYASIKPAGPAPTTTTSSIASPPSTSPVVDPEKLSSIAIGAMMGESEVSKSMLNPTMRYQAGVFHLRLGAARATRAHPAAWGFGVAAVHGRSKMPPPLTTDAAKIVD